MDRYIGKLLDERYEILEEIGSGGMAVVYKAMCNRLNRPVAIKILKDGHSQDAEFRRRFRVESQAVAMLSHPNIVSVYDVSHSDGVDYIVMELIDGISLKQYMEQKGVLSWRETLHFGIQICKALEHAHSRGIIHRDIKPHNIMILKDGSVKVADFGIARIANAGSTLTREAIGSVHYISPEQAKGGKLDSRSDLYSLGVVLYEMLTGRTPYDGESAVSVAIQHINAGAAAPRSLNPSIPLGLEQITMRAMEADLSQRYASASQMLQDLEAFRQNPSAVFAAEPAAPGGQPEVAEVEPLERKPAKRQKKRRRWPSVIIALLIFSAAATGLVYLFMDIFGDLGADKENVFVPSLVNMTALEAQNRYKSQFNFEIIEKVPDTDIEAGRIMEQKPSEGMEVKVGSTITITVSTGLQTYSMPNLVNYSLSEAMQILASFDVTVKEVRENNESFYTDYIIRTEPGYGIPLSPGQEVTLVISMGSSVQLIPTPPVVSYPLTEAIMLLQQAGLNWNNIKYVNSSAAKDTVVFQSIPAGEMVHPGTSVDLDVSLGPRVKAEVPVIGYQPSALIVKQNELAALTIVASVSDGGILSYEWLVSYTDSSADLQPVGTGQTLSLDTSTPGTANYCCKITNTLHDSVVSTYSNMIKVTVQPAAEQVTKSFHLTLPADGPDMATILVKMDGTDHIPAFEVARADGAVTIEITSTETHVVDVYVDGVLALSQTVVFTE